MTNTMKNILKATLLTLACGAVLTACDKWEDYNTNSFGVTDQMLEADYNNIGAYYPQILQSVYFNFSDYAWEFQLLENLTADAWCGYLETASAFQGNSNTTTYAMIDGWIAAQWNDTYNYVMAPIFNSIEPQANNDDYYYFYAPALIIKVIAMSKVSDAYGPIVYTEYGKNASGNTYDSQETAYKAFFADLDTAIAYLDKFITEYPGATPFKNFDEWCDGDFSKWIKLANTIRLRLAFHIVKADPALAQSEAEKAISNKWGVLEGDEIVTEHGATWKHPLYTLSTGWSDTYMGAGIETYLTGYNDPRESVYFTKATNAKAVELGQDFASIRLGIATVAKGDYAGYSGCAQAHEAPATICSAAEAYFLRAEGVLRGWNMGGGTAKEYYEAGVTASFNNNGCKGVEDYLASDATQADYVDPVTPTFNIAAVSTVTPKWDESLTNEEKLEKIITQKYIACYPDGYEAWTALRRTGYPKLFPIIDNHSEGVLKDDEVVRRMPYFESLKSNDPTGYAKAVELLGGTDNAATRLWWDKDVPNF